jgi:site-specific recombinase XerD
MKTFDEIIPSFLSNIKIKVKERTYKSYLGKINIFSRWLALYGFSDTPLAKIDEQIIEQFSIYLADEKKLDRPTCHKYCNNIRQVFQYAMTRGEIIKLPFDLFVLPQKKADMGAQVIEKEHMRTLLTEIKKKDKQLYVACLMEYYCFTRPGRELRLLKVKDIDTINWTIKVDADHAKNGHKRIVTVPNELITVLKEYGIEKADKDLFIFGKHKNTDTVPCSINVLRYRFNKYRDKFGMPKEYKFYSFKATGATSLHNTNMVSLRSIMTQLGHLNLSSTQYYIQKHAGIIDTVIRDNFPNPMRIN